MESGRYLECLAADAARLREVAAATVAGDPTGVLLWLWRRVGDDRVRLDGDRVVIAKLRQLLGDATV